ncbi:MAG: 2-oxoglutarate dehydrogenase E1 subunit family protein, partial [Ilumatobacteraceae bacterium]
MSDTPAPSFGANSWLVEEMYERYVADPSSVAESWKEFFEDYRSIAAPAVEPAVDTA